jgi:tRNA pseudouridine38-40 synthase
MAYGVLLTLAYDGALFSGFARQRNARTVAGELEGAIRAIDPHASLVRAVSRTDAGVHARGQRVAFDTAKSIAPRGWVLALARELPEQISVVAVAEVEAGYDPRHHAVEKTYRYFVLQSPVRDPFAEHRAWRVYERLNHDAMRSEASALLGTHDFRAFRSSSDTRQDTVRQVLRASMRVSPGDPRCLEIEITGNRFMHRMVRIIAGTLVDVGRSRLAPGAVTRALSSGVREDLGMTAPPDGLFLEQIVLSNAGWNPWPNG